MTLSSCSLQEVCTNKLERFLFGLGVSYHMGIHVATYNYFLTVNEHPGATKDRKGVELYKQQGLVVVGVAVPCDDPRLSVVHVGIGVARCTSFLSWG